MPAADQRTAMYSQYSTGRFTYRWFGQELARQLGVRGVKLILTAHSADKLEALATSIRTDSHVETKIYPADFPNPEPSTRLIAG